MKKIIFSAAILFSCLLFKTAEAQISVNLGVNIGSQPAWGPVGYDRADYYYMPDIDTYYDVPAHQYVYYNNNAWIRSSRLPAIYNNYNVYNGYKVVINDTRNPWERANVYRAKYKGFKGRHDQVIIRNSREVKYVNHWKPGKGPEGPGRGPEGRPGRGPERGPDRGPDRGPGRGPDRGPDHGPDRGHGNGHDRH